MSFPILSKTYTELVLLIALEMSASTQASVMKFLHVHGNNVERLFSSQAFTILTQQIQTGINPMQGRRDLNVPVTAYDKVPSKFSRFFHSKMVAAICTVLACRVDMDMYHVSVVTIAGACHDLGHAKFSHLAEHLLTSLDKEQSTHEEIGLKKLLTDTELLSVVRDMEVNVQHVTRCMREEGSLGAMLKLADTLGYTTIDSLVSGFFGHSNETRAILRVLYVLANINRVNYKGVIETNTRLPIQHLVDRRAYMMRDLYYSDMSTLNGICFMTLMTYALENNVLTRNDFYNDKTHEHELLAKVQSYAETRQDFVGQWLMDLVSMFVTLKLPTDRWRVQRFYGNDNGSRWVSELASTTREFTLYGLNTCTNHLVKTYEVLTPTNQQQTIQPSPAILKAAQDSPTAFAMVPTFIP